MVQIHVFILIHYSEQKELMLGAARGSYWVTGWRAKHWSGSFLPAVCCWAGSPGRLLSISRWTFLSRRESSLLSGSRRWGEEFQVCSFQSETFSDRTRVVHWELLLEFQVQLFNYISTPIFTLCLNEPSNLYRPVWAKTLPTRIHDEVCLRRAPSAPNGSLSIGLW